MTPSFDSLSVLTLESRRAKELASLISTYGGRPVVAPALREVPLESNPAAFDFARDLVRDAFDVVIFLTGVGARALIGVIETAHPRDEVLAALARTRVVVRGPKPLAVLRDLRVPVWATAPEPNTWRELLAELDAKAGECPLRGARVAVQEYGVSNPELLAGLRERGAEVTAVPVYQWALPEDTEPLKEAVRAISRGDIDIAIFTTRVQVVHLWQIAAAMGLEADLRRGLTRTVVASIGPTTSEELRDRGLDADIEASHPKLGFLVREAADRGPGLLRAKR